MASNGLAVSRHPSGQVVFLEGALPGEEVIAMVADERRHYLTARVTRVVTASAARLEPRCGHVTEGCGGCQWQHVGVDAQVQFKRQILIDTIRRIGRIECPELSETVVLEPWNFPHLATGHRRGRSGRFASGSFERRHTRAGLPGGAPALGRVAGRTSLPRSGRGSSPVWGVPGSGWCRYGPVVLWRTSQAMSGPTGCTSWQPGERGGCRPVHSSSPDLMESTPWPTW